MANTQAFCTSAKPELLNAVHQFGSPTITSRTSLTAPTADTFKGALYFATATYNASTTAYSSTGEVANSGSYTAGGIAFTFGTAPTSSGTTGYVTPSASWTTGPGFSAAAFDTILMYNSTQGNKAFAVFTFGSQTIVSGTFTLTMPTNDATNALIRIA
ncbi:MAG: hypothetical protein KGL39_16770 [Patescibacteria group bacterium]|nr:hypothetical protein [Patescibacteria group bacterium]